MVVAEDECYDKKLNVGETLNVFDDDLEFEFKFQNIEQFICSRIIQTARASRHPTEGTRKKDVLQIVELAMVEPTYVSLLSEDGVALAFSLKITDVDRSGEDGLLTAYGSMRIKNEEVKIKCASDAERCWFGLTIKAGGNTRAVSMLDEMGIDVWAHGNLEALNAAATNSYAHWVLTI